MKIPKPFLLILAAILAFAAFTPPRASAQVSVDFFYSNLHPYGEWVNCSYGYCWHPVNVADNWAPYTDGYWAYTDYGWTWVSYEDYGGIVYHYGRWVNLEDEGWVWVPGFQWAPAWVSWRSSPDYVGWAPLPPEAVFQVGFGFGGWSDARFNIGPGSYNFVGIHNFGAPALGGVIVSREQNVDIIRNTTNITNITTNTTTINNTTIDNAVYNGGPSYQTIAAHSERPIPTLHLVRDTNPASNGKLMAHQQGNQLVVPAPKVTAPAGGKLPPPAYVAKTLPATAKANHGWSVVKDPQQRAQLQAKVKSEAPVYKPAKPVNPADVKLVSQKIKEAPAAKPAAALKPQGEPETGANTEAGGRTPEVKANGPVKAGAGGKMPKAETAGEPEKKKTSDAALENAPAAEAPAATPKPSKHKYKAAITPANTPENGEAPVKKSKKKPTVEPGTGKPSNLQPFNAENPIPSSKKHSVSNVGGNGNGDVPVKKHPQYGAVGNPNGPEFNGQPAPKKHPVAPGANPEATASKKKQPEPAQGAPFQ